MFGGLVINLMIVRWMINNVVNVLVDVWFCGCYFVINGDFYGVVYFGYGLNYLLIDVVIIY